MKSLKEQLIIENKNITSLKDLNYIMIYKNFKKWITQQPKQNIYITVGIVDDIDLHDLDSDQFTETYYNNDEWIGDLAGDEVPVKEWTLGDEDIILVWKK